MRTKLIITLLICAANLAFGQTPTNKFPDTGNVGIGNLYPQYSLDINQDAPGIRMMEKTTGGNRRLQVSVNTTDGEIGFVSTYGTGGNYPFVFRLGGVAQDVMRIATNGNVGIGISNPQAKLSVNGNILAKEVKVKSDISVPDYVFEENYQLPTLEEIEAYVTEHRHLPEIPSAKDIERDGLNLAEMNLLLLKKVEELTLYIIDQQKQLGSLKEQNTRQQEEIDRLNQNDDNNQ